MTLTKAHLTDSVHRRLGMPKTRSAAVVNTLFEKGEDVLISGFGKFCVKDNKGRRGRNSFSPKDAMLGPQRIVTFKCSSVFRKRLTKGNG